jgi:multimeric flavodoxin WrbA
MNITVIYGQGHKGNTWTLTSLFLERLKDKTADIEEFFLPAAAPGYCVGCMNCIMRDEKTCPHAGAVQKIAASLDKADLIVVASPSYVFGMTGQLKTLCDHFAYRYMAHRPEASMFRKQALVLSTAAGAGTGKTMKAIAFNLFMWGVPLIYKCGVVLNAGKYADIPDKKKQRVERKADKITRKILRRNNRVKAGFKTRFIFSMMRLNQKQNDWSIADREYWEAKGWLGKEKPYNK